jgi:hypothetical protein
MDACDAENLFYDYIVQATPDIHGNYPALTAEEREAFDGAC